MAESSPSSVECPICGETFDPAAAGGWCTNAECGEWKYEGSGSPDPDEGVTGDDPLAAVTGSPPGREDPTTDGGEEAAGQTTAADEEDVSGATDDEPADLADVNDDDAAADEQDDAGANEQDDGASADEVDVSGEPDDRHDEVADEHDDAAADEHDDEPEAAAHDQHGDAVGGPAEAVDATETSDEERRESTDEAGGVCPDCGTTVDPGDNFCASCGADLSTPSAPPTLSECPTCGEAVDEDDSYCAGCGEDLDAVRAEREGDGGAGDEELVLRARGRSVPVEDGSTVGREFRRIVTETGGEEDEAIRIHREHVRFVREGGQFFVVDLGDNPTLVNGDRVGKGNRTAVAPGDTITLSNVVTADVTAPEA